MRLGDVPDDEDALILLSVEELAVNELRETFHHWVRTLVFPVVKGRLGEPLPHQPAAALRECRSVNGNQFFDSARDIQDEVEPDLKDYLAAHAKRLTEQLKRQLEEAGQQAKAREEERYRSRRGEVSSLIAENTLTKLEREIAKLKVERQQGMLFDEESEQAPQLPGGGPHAADSDGVVPPLGKRPSVAAAHATEVVQGHVPVLLVDRSAGRNELGGKGGGEPDGVSGSDGAGDRLSSRAHSPRGS